MEKQRTKPKQKAWLRLSRKSTTSPRSEATKLDPAGPSSAKGSGRSSNEDESPRPKELNVWSQGTRHLAPTPSPQAQRPRLKYMDNPEEDRVIREALAACRDHKYTRFNLERHVLSGEHIPIQRLKRGDVVFLCTTHELYGPGQRRYLYWVTNGGKGVIRGSHNWFLEPTKYRFTAEPYHDRNAYVSWTQAVAISPPRRDSIFGCVVEEEQITGGDLRDLGEFVAHQMEHHKNDVSDLCQGARELLPSAQSANGVSRRGDAWLTTKHCGVDGCAFSREAIDAWKEAGKKVLQKQVIVSSKEKSRPPESASHDFLPRVADLHGPVMHGRLLLHGCLLSSKGVLLAFLVVSADRVPKVARGADDNSILARLVDPQILGRGHRGADVGETSPAKNAVPASWFVAEWF
ncbi:hypothetical protein CEP54_008566 [Fusarium duplospermum]|uniref:Uncharacterized protein n=1 Tax=Fusarium duplospermum TaxID=1325734 RepID=A0A428PV14_9HYPO|nr:hypothetical protein CEP54_008566 [Fusarium duplospermum]